jgi:hypothetical protein
MDLHVKLYYLRDSPLLRTQKPYMVGPGFLKTIPTCNYRLAPGPEQLIEDVRGSTEEFTLAKQGFTFRSWSPSEIDWTDENQIVNTYLSEAQELVRQELNLGEDFVRSEVFDWRVSCESSSYI